MDRTLEQMTQEEIDMRAEVANEVFGDGGDNSTVDSQQRSDQTSRATDDVDLNQSQQDSVDDDPPPDPWEGVNPALRQTIEAMNQRLQIIDNLQTRVKQAESRVGSLQNQITNGKQAARTVDDAPSKADIEAAAKSDKAWEELKEEFPEWGQAIDGRLAAERAEISKKMGLELTEKLNAIKEEIQRSAPGETGNIQEMILDVAHDDWREVIRTPEYQTWLAQQPDSIKQLTNSPLAKDAAKVLREFKKTTTTTQKTAASIAADRKQRLVTSQTPRSRVQPRVQKSDADMTDAEYRRKLEAEIWGT